MTDIPSASQHDDPLPGHRRAAPNRIAFGDINAEEDKLLDSAFFSTRDYKLLSNSEGTTVVVGRRGTGKTSLAKQLIRTFDASKAVKTLHVAPDTESVLLLRKYTKGFPTNYQRAIYKKAWRIAFVHHALALLDGHYKIKSHPIGTRIRDILSGRQVRFATDRAHAFLAEACKDYEDPDDVLHAVKRVADSMEALSLLEEACAECSIRFILLIDRVDEGYEPDDIGVSIAAGLVSTATELGRSECFRATVVFLRDNIARALSKMDPDYSRVVESKVLRLHWSEIELFHMVAERIRASFSLADVSARDCWNSLVNQTMHDQAGFRRALYHTLHRPRDIILLLNGAYWDTVRSGGHRIDYANVEAAARSISTTRLDDLIGEYRSVVPALPGLVKCLVGGRRIWSQADILKQIDSQTRSDDNERSVEQDLRFRSPREWLRVMYESGLLGARDSTSGRFMFCYDGVAAQADLGNADTFMVHPCYWLALDVSDDAADLDSKEISDEYEITVLSPSREHRTHRIGQIVARLSEIDAGDSGWSSFEDWCLEVLRITFAGVLRNIEARPNGTSPNRRDIVGTNLGDKGFWRRVRDDYAVRQVVFEVKNYADPTPDDFRQVIDYLSGNYGMLGFLICRGFDENIKRGPILDRIRRIWSDHKKVVLVIGDKWLRRILEKLRNPERESYPEDACNRILDTYERHYR